MKIALISLGCPKNQVDADVMAHALLEAGHTTVAAVQEADCVLINTCGFIESAKQEAIDTILEACSHKAQNPALKVVVTGCLAERYKEEIRQRDARGGRGGGHRLPIPLSSAILARLAQGEAGIESLRPQGRAAALRQACHLPRRTTMHI